MTFPAVISLTSLRLNYEVTLLPVKHFLLFCNNIYNLTCYFDFKNCTLHCNVISFNIIFWFCNFMPCKFVSSILCTAFSCPSFSVAHASPDLLHQFYCLMVPQASIATGEVIYSVLRDTRRYSHMHFSVRIRIDELF